MEAVIVTILFLAVVGFLVYLITEYIPMPPVFKQVIIVGCVILLVIWLAAIMFGGASVPSMPRFGN